MAELSNLKPDRRNANKGTVRGRALLEDSLRRYGAGRSILADKHGNVIAGNKTLEASVDIGLPVRFVESDGTELVVVQRTDLDLDTEQARSLAYLDNRVAELDLDWDVSALLEDRDAGLDLAAVGFSDDELAALLAGVEDTTEGLTDPDAVPAVPEVPITKPGDLWLLGRHRLLCGDSTVATDVERLLGGQAPAFVWGDPPYGIALDRDAADRRRGFYGGTAIDEDNAPWDSAQMAEWIGLWGALLAPGGYLASWCAYQGIGTVERAALDAGLIWLNLFTWVKENPPPGFPEYLAKSCEHSPIFRKPGPGRYIGPELVRDYAVSPVTPQSERYGDHPSPKRIDVIAPVIEKLTRADALVADPFGGSGSTLIAAEQTGRTAYLMELSPAYCDVIVTRWQDFTGQEARRG